MPAEAAAATSNIPPARPRTARVFFALWPTPELAGQLAEIARTAAERHGGRPTRPETIHLTLAFLGGVPEELLPGLIQLAADIAVPPFTLAIDRLAFWQHNHLLWAGCSAPPPAVRQLVDALRAGLGQAGVRVDAGRRDFTPHVSLVRRVPEASAPAPGQVPLPLAGLDWSCRSFVLVRSRPSAAGSDYQILAEFALRP
ncbi:MAG: RNA 2',3'-cyclic phosphodiesterase [Bacteroidota bacterium]